MDSFKRCLVILLYFTHFAVGQKIMQSIDPVHKRAGDDAMLRCITYSLKDSNVIWLKFLPKGGSVVISVHNSIQAANPILSDGREKYAIDMYKTTKRQVNFDLYIRQLVADDSSTYQCMIMKMGEAPGRFPRVNGTLEVQYAPTIDVGLTSSWVDVAENGSAILRCAADGVPIPVISWIRANGLPFLDGSIVKEGAELYLQNVAISDRGVYRCRAVNNVSPSAVSDVMLDVHFRPSIKPFRPYVGQSPDMNVPAELTCLASGKPPPVLVWYKREGARRKEIMDDAFHIVDVYDAVLVGPDVRDGDRWFSLRILNIQHRDYGDYECEARNVYGASSSNIKFFYTPTCQGRSCAHRLGATRVEVPQPRRQTNSAKSGLHYSNTCFILTSLLFQIFVSSIN